MLSQSRKAAILEKFAQQAPTIPPIGESVDISPINTRSAASVAAKAPTRLGNLSNTTGTTTPGAGKPAAAAPVQYGKRPAVTTIDMTGN